jgi:hypothetical protein
MNSAPTQSNACSLMCGRVAFRISCSPVRRSGTESFLLADRQRVTTSAVIGLVRHDAALPAIESLTAASRRSPSTGSLSGPKQQAVPGIAQVILQTLGEPMRIDGTVIQLSAIVGVLLPGQTAALSSEVLLSAADDAMYPTK